MDVTISFLYDHLLKSSKIVSHSFENTLLNVSCTVAMHISCKGVELLCVYLVSWSWLRVPGVLQRLGFTYFILSLMETFWGQKEIPMRKVSPFSHHVLISDSVQGTNLNIAGID